jgi:mono/diheme cytochrome c family protein
MTSGYRVLLAVLATCAHVTAAAADTNLVERGDTVFQRLCAACHGQGRGDDSEPATMLPGTLALRLKYRGERPMLLEDRTDLSPAVLRVFVRNGVGSMPPFRPTELTDGDIEAIAAYLTRSRP